MCIRDSNKVNTLSLASPASLRIEMYSSMLHELFIILRKSKENCNGKSIKIKQIGAPIQYTSLNKLVAPIYSAFPDKDLSQNPNDSVKTLSNT